MEVIIWFVAFLISYALGCINVAYYWTRWSRGTDIRGQGSGNAGARNVGRIYGMRGFLVVLLLDGLLGAAAVATGLALSGQQNLLPGCCALLVMVGHVFPVQLGGKGGKGLAKALGALVALVASGAAASLWLDVLGMMVFLIYTHRSNISRYIRK